MTAAKGDRFMRRIIGPILALFGILAVIGVATGVAYTAGLNAGTAAVTTVSAAGTTTVVPVAGYGWYGVPWFGFGFGQFLFVLIGFFLIVALLRVAFGAGRHHGRGYGWGGGYGWGPGYGRGPGGWDRHGPGGGPGGPTASGDPREAWIRGRLDEWHTAAHAGGAPAPSGGPTAPSAGTTGPTTGGPTTGGPTEPPAAG